MRAVDLKLQNKLFILLSKTLLSSPPSQLLAAGELTDTTSPQCMLQLYISIKKTLDCKDHISLTACEVVVDHRRFDAKPLL